MYIIENISIYHTSRDHPQKAFRRLNSNTFSQLICVCAFGAQKRAFLNTQHGTRVRAPENSRSVVTKTYLLVRAHLAGRCWSWQHWGGGSRWHALRRDSPMVLFRLKDVLLPKTYLPLQAMTRQVFMDFQSSPPSRWQCCPALELHRDNCTNKWTEECDEQFSWSPSWWILLTQQAWAACPNEVKRETDSIKHFTTSWQQEMGLKFHVFLQNDLSCTNPAHTRTVWLCCFTALRIFACSDASQNLNQMQLQFPWVSLQSKKYSEPVFFFFLEGAVLSPKQSARTASTQIFSYFCLVLAHTLQFVTQTCPHLDIYNLKRPSSSRFRCRSLHPEQKFLRSSCPEEHMGISIEVETKRSHSLSALEPLHALQQFSSCWSWSCAPVDLIPIWDYIYMVFLSKARFHVFLVRVERNSVHGSMPRRGLFVGQGKEDSQYWLHCPQEHCHQLGYRMSWNLQEELFTKTYPDWCHENWNWLLASVSVCLSLWGHGSSQLEISGSRFCFCKSVSYPEESAREINRTLTSTWKAHSLPQSDW